ncbi:MAG TPA: hypothetical protein PLG66_00895 [Calditrichia bacterium]|nr:hypothetical protein [Calditrichia bacterium]
MKTLSDSLSNDQPAFEEPSIHSLFLEGVLEHAGEGYFLLDSALVVQNPLSRSAMRCLGEENPVGRPFLKILENKVTGEIIERSREYLTLLFDPDLDEETLGEINPLAESEFCYENKRGLWEESSQLRFSFDRLFEDGQVRGILGRVRDVSHEHELQKRLNSTEHQVRQQMEWLVNILHVESSALREFLAGAERELQNIEERLRTPGKPGEYPQVLEDIYRSVYIIRGNAALMDLSFFTEFGHQFLNLIADIRQKTAPGAHDFIPVVVRVKELRSTLTEV